MRVDFLRLLFYLERRRGNNLDTLFAFYYVTLKVIFPSSKSCHKGSVGLLHGDKQRIVKAVIVEAGEKGATIVIGDNANGIQIQQNSDGATQEMTNSQTFNYDKALEVLKEIREYVDFPQFQTTFKENSENVKTIIEDTIKAVESKEDVGIVKKSLRILKDLAVGASGSLIASGIIALLGTLPL
jgi:hypothetical protein